MSGTILREPRKPRHYWASLTYIPKIERVLKGEIRQTIRAGREYRPGDHIAFHGWAGPPYRSKWSFRTEPFLIVSTQDIIIKDHGVRFGRDTTTIPWDALDWLAKDDGIVPPLGEELGRVLIRMNGTPREAQIIRWDYDR